MEGTGEASQPDGGGDILRPGDPEYARVRAQIIAECKLHPEPENTHSVDPDDQMWTGYVSDSNVFIAGKRIKPQHWGYYYDTGLCAKLGLCCYNFHKGTSYGFGSVRRLYTRDDDSSTTSFITLEAVNPADRSRLTLETCVKHNDEQIIDGVSLWWETYICRLQGSEEADYEWDDKAIDDQYKGEMPQWLSDDDRKRCYVVKESELDDQKNWWLPLFTELAFYTKWNETLQVPDIAEWSRSTTLDVVVETRGEAETKPRDKLKADNAIFYISFMCGDDPATGKLANYRAVVRKTMDGKPGHVRLEVMCWTI